MELTANRRPFLYFPLRHHFEQNFHVAHRLDRYRAGRRMDYATSDRDAIAAGIGRPVDYRPVETDGAARAARSSPNSCEEPRGRLELGVSLIRHIPAKRSWRTA